MFDKTLSLLLRDVLIAGYWYQHFY